MEENKESVSVETLEEVNVENTEVINKEIETNKVEKDDKTKKILMIVAISLFVIGVVILFCVAILGGSDNKKDEKKEETKTSETQYTNKTYFMFMDINPAIKFEIEERYTECTTGECLVEIVVKNYELIEEDTEDVFKGYEIPENNELNDVIADLFEYAENNGYYYEEADFYSESLEVGGYLNIYNDGFTYSFYYIAINSVDDFYGRQNYEDNNVEEEPTVTKQYTVTDPSVMIKNTKKGYIYNYSEKIESVLVSVTGKYSEVEYLDKDMSFYVDVKGLKPGTEEVELFVNNKDNLDLEFVVSPKTIKVVIKDSNETITTSTTTTKEQTTKTTSRDEVEINLNDNVQYYEITSCGGYESIENKCIGKTVGELKKLFPNYNRELDEVSYYTDDSEFYDYYSLLNYFPECHKSISESTKNSLSKVQGFAPTFNDDFMKPNWIIFKNSKYSKFQWSVKDYSKYDLYYEVLCGGGGEGQPTYYTLDEESCSKYNLPCGRW